MWKERKRKKKTNSGVPGAETRRRMRPRGMAGAGSEAAEALSLWRGPQERSPLSNDKHTN